MGVKKMKIDKEDFKILSEIISQEFGLNEKNFRENYT